MAGNAPYVRSGSNLGRSCLSAKESDNSPSVTWAQDAGKGVGKDSREALMCNYRGEVKKNRGG